MKTADEGVEETGQKQRRRKRGRENRVCRSKRETKTESWKREEA